MMTQRNYADCCILVVDDNITNRTILKALLGKRGVQVITANDGRQAIDLLGQHQFDVIFMDRRMPVMGGEEASRHIHACDDSIPIIGMTADTQASERLSFLKSGLVMCLDKPISNERLWQVVDEMLGIDSTHWEPSTQVDDSISEPASSEYDNRPDDIAVSARMLEMLTRDLPERRRAINAAMAENDLETVAFAAHAIAGAAAICEQPVLADAALSLEHSARAGDASVPINVQDLLYEIEQYLQEADTV